MSPLTESTRLILKKDSVAATDTNIREVSLLLHGNGTNGSTTITDSSLTPKTVTAVGNAQISTAIADPFGNNTRGVIAFDGSGDGISVTSATDFSFGTGDFTVEFWVKFNSVSATPNLFDMRSTDPQAAPNLYVTGSKINLWFSALNRIVGTTILNTSSFYHIALARNAGSLKLFLNGTQEGATSATPESIVSTIFTAGCPSQGTFINFLNGYMDDIRVTKGVARYTANFTPPTLPFPDF
jgi:hypothetical protein